MILRSTVERRATNRRKSERVDADVVARMLHGFLCTATCSSGFLIPTSISAMVRNAGGEYFGELLIILSGVIGLLIIIDTFINDIRPPEVQLPWTSKHRHWLHLLGVMGNMIGLFTVAMTGPASAVMTGVAYFYLGVSGFGVAIAWRDVRRRPGHAVWGT